MTDTDKAFIRVYEDQRVDAAERAGRPPSLSRQPHHESTAVPYVSQFYTAATHAPATQPLASAPRRPTDTRRTATDAVAQTPPSAQRYTLGTVGGLTSADEITRQDGAQTLPAPHLPAAAWQKQQPVHGNPPARRGEQRQAAVPSRPRTLRPFRPQWEVDSFVLPEVCARLQSESSVGLAELFRAVLLRAWRGRPVVALSAFDGGEGTTTVTLCLARLAATFATRIAVVDGNLVHPSVSDVLGLKVRNSWIAPPEDQPLTECAIGAGDDRMVILPLADPPEMPVADRQERARRILQSLRSCFDLVLIDAGPIFQAAHLWFRAGMEDAIDAAVVVRDLRRTSPLQLEDVCLRIRQAGVRDVSVVENFQTSPLAIE